MTYALGDVIARIGGDGGGTVPTPHRYVHDFGPTPIPAGGALSHEVPGVPEGATLVATLEWDGPETGGPVVVSSGTAAAVGVAMDFGDGFFPVTIAASDVITTEGGVTVRIEAGAEGYTATRLTAIIIPTINEAT
ncbi:hypothetical protein FOB82_10615 [Corynebacterium xerosis]|uniref:Uncharacterized protein n=1 Tax=Corynebacterium xerosis TaxID=1725 RepID=A0A6B8TEL8_9CORY|nr:hypothetical protein [Corynebacterium xerosis]QGS35317.1 hypothetical protein FOB82_10615 [Corynebacterium xerosis]